MGQKSVMTGILSVLLPDEERAEFKAWASEVGPADFFRCLPVYFKPGEIQSAVLEYVTMQLAELEQTTDCRIDAVVQIQNVGFNYRSYNEVMQV